MKYFDRHAIETRLLLFTVLGYGQHRGAVLNLLYVACIAQLRGISREAWLPVCPLFRSKVVLTKSSRV